MIPPGLHALIDGVERPPESTHGSVGQEGLDHGVELEAFRGRHVRERPLDIAARLLHDFVGSVGLKDLDRHHQALLDLIGLAGGTGEGDAAGGDSVTCGRVPHTINVDRELGGRLTGAKVWLTAALSTTVRAAALGIRFLLKAKLTKKSDSIH